MHVHTDISLLATMPSVFSAANYHRTPAPSSTPYPDLIDAGPASAAVSHTHRVAPGENLTRIVRQFLIDQGQQPDNTTIYQGVATVTAANRLRNPDLIYPGQDLDLSALLPGHPTTPEPVQATLSPLPQAAMPPAPGPVTMTPVPAQRLLGLTPLPDPLAVGDAVPEPTDVLLKQSLAPKELTQLAANIPPTTVPTVAEVRHRPAGGAGPVPSDAAIALQRILNGTSNALSLLRELVEPGSDNHSRKAEPGPWSPVLGASARLTSEFGLRKDPFLGTMEFHDGIDLAVKRGTEITALRDGEVIFSGWRGGYGNTVVVRHDDGLESLYAHAARIHVREGERVPAGTVLADVGSSGRSTGPHLHLEVRRNGVAVNPMPFLEESRAGLAP